MAKNCLRSEYNTTLGYVLPECLVYLHHHLHIRFFGRGTLHQPTSTSPRYTLLVYNNAPPTSALLPPLSPARCSYGKSPASTLVQSLSDREIRELVILVVDEGGRLEANFLLKQLVLGDIDVGQPGLVGHIQQPMLNNLRTSYTVHEAGGVSSA